MNKNTKTSGISAGVFLISLAVLIVTGWWWPGILLAIGLAAGTRLVFDRQYARGLTVFAVFAAIPLLLPLFTGVASAIPWGAVVPLILVTCGVVVLTKAVFLKE